MKTLVTAAVLLALTTPGDAAPKGEWFLIFDIWLCDVHDCGEGKPPDEDYVSSETFATQKQCLAQVHRFVKIASDKPDTKIRNTVPRDALTLDAVWHQAEKDFDTAVGEIRFHCEWHR